MRSDRAGRALAAVAAWLILNTACGEESAVPGRALPASDTSATDATASTDGAPVSNAAPGPSTSRCAASGDAHAPLLLAVGTTVWLVENGARTEAAAYDGDVRLAFADRSGVVVAAVAVGSGPDSRQRTWIDESGVRREIVEEGSAGVVLYELTEVDGSPLVIYAPIREPDEQGMPERTPILAARLDGTDRRTLGNAFAPEWRVLSASAAAGFVVFTAASDLTETLFTTRLRDRTVLRDRFAPDPPYNSPPLVTSAVLHPDGTELAWMEGPDWDGSTGRRSDDPWELVIADAVTGDVRLRRALLEPAENVLHLEWNGRRAIVNRSERPPLLVGTDHSTAPLLELCDLRGTATFLRPRG